MLDSQEQEHGPKEVKELGRENQRTQRSFRCDFPGSKRDAEMTDEHKISDSKITWTSALHASGDGLLRLLPGSQFPVLTCTTDLLGRPTPCIQPELFNDAWART